MSLNIVTLEEIKANARIEGTAEDTLIQGMGEAAEQAVLNLIDRSLEDITEEYGTVPAPIKHAVLMYTNHLYEHRSIVNPTALYNIPYSIDALIKHYIKL
jgi:uncharacterized phage protein (predicted DNA packaging)